MPSIPPATSATRWSCRGEFLRTVPTLVVEILSHSTARRDRTKKKAVYARNGVAEYWIVDPDARSVTVHVLGDGLDVLVQRTYVFSPFVTSASWTIRPDRRPQHQE